MRTLPPPAQKPHPAAGDRDRADADRLLFERLADHRDSVDREVLVERFLPLARSLAARYRRGSEPFEDVFQVACVGLVNAIDRYDPRRGQAFSSFAVPTIAGEIKRYYRDRTWSIHVPRDLQELTLRVERARGALEAELGHSPTATELGERIGVDEELVIEALQARQAMQTASLDVPAKTDDDASVTVGELVGVCEEGFGRAEVRADLAILTRALRPRERLVLRLRFERDLTQQEIGEIVGISQMQVSRILRGAVERLREHARAQQAAGASRQAAGASRQAAGASRLEQTAVAA
jgi:RNA polymerase sigma-B factor